MHYEYELPDIAAGMEIGSRPQTKPAEVLLRDVIDFVDFLRDKAPSLEIGAALQALAGLRVQEVTRLPWNKVDLERGLVEVSGEVKNEHSVRTIPVCSRVMDALKRAYDRRKLTQGKIREIQEAIVSRPLGKPYGEWWQAYSKAVKMELKEWNPSIRWQCKDLRNCLPTYAAIHGLSSDVLEMYLGHAPKTITAKHYVVHLNTASIGEAEELERRTEIFRKQVVAWIDKAIDGKAEARILNNFKREPENLLMGSK